MNIESDLHQLGYIRGAYGVRGMVRVYPFGSKEGALVNAKRWYLKHEKTGETQVCEVVQAKAHGSEVVARFKECKTREMAESFQGWGVWISRDDFPNIDEDTFYWVDLIGLSCVDMQNERIGIVQDVFENGAQAVLVIQRQEMKDEAWICLRDENNKLLQMLVPFVFQHVPVVDLEQGYIQVDWPLDL